MTGTRLAVVGASHARLPVDARERLHLTADDAVLLARELTRHGGEAICLSTCNRTEIYLAGVDVDDARRALGAASDALTVLVDDEAVAHLFRVAAGLESLVLGESQILGQVRAALAAARAAGTVGPVLDRLFAHALRTGKRIRTETQIAERSPSLAGVAVGFAARVLDGLKGRRAVVIGAGHMAELALAELVDSGVEKVVVVSRSAARSERLVRTYGGRYARPHSLARELRAADVVVSATAAPDFVLTPAHLGERRRPLLAFDLAMPRDIDPAVRQLAGTALFDVDDLGAVGRATGPAAEEVARAEAIVAEEAERFARRRASLAAVPAITTLRDRAEAVRQATLDRHRSRLDALAPEYRALLETVTEQLVAALMHEPTVELRRAAEAA